MVGNETTPPFTRSNEALWKRGPTRGKLDSSARKCVQVAHRVADKEGHRGQLKTKTNIIDARR